MSHVDEGAHGLEGAGAAGQQVGAVEGLQEADEVGALRLERGRERFTGSVWKRASGPVRRLVTERSQGERWRLCADRGRHGCSVVCNQGLLARTTARGPKPIQLHNAVEGISGETKPVP